MSNYKTWLSDCTDSRLECKAFVEVLETAGYTRANIKAWAPTKVQSILSFMHNSSTKQYKNLQWAKREYKTSQEFANKMSGTLLETLWEAIVNSHKLQRVLPGQPEKCYHRGDFGIEDHELGSPDKITESCDGEYTLCSIKSSIAGPRAKINANTHNTANIFQWQRGLRKKNSNNEFLSANVQFISNANVGQNVLDGFDDPIYKGGPYDLCVLADGQSKQFWYDFWEAVWEIREIRDASETVFDLYDDQKEKLFNPVYNSTEKVMTMLGACGIGKTAVFRELVRRDYRENNIENKAIYSMSVPRLALAAQHIGTFLKLDDYAIIVNATMQQVKHDFKENIQLNIATTNPEEIAQNLLEYAFGAQTVPLLIMNTDKGITRLAKAFKYIEEGHVCIDEYADPKDTFAKVTELCRQFHHDEAHNLAASAEIKDDDDKRQKTKLMEALPYFINIFNKTVHWTATKKTSIGNKNLYDMNNTDIFGEVAGVYSFGEAMKNGRILECYVRLVKLTKEDFAILGLIPEQDVSITYLIKAIKDHKAYCDARNLNCQIIFFSDGVDCLKPYKEILERVFQEEGIYVNYVTAGTNQRDRAKIFDEYQNSKFGVLMNFNIIAEGIDIHSTTAVVIGRGMNDIKLVQSAGRCIRLLNEDRQAFLEGKIKVGDHDNWRKPMGCVYLFKNEALIEDHTKTDTALEALAEFQDQKMVYKFDLLKNAIAKGNKRPLTDPNQQEDSAQAVEDLEEKLQIETRLESIRKARKECEKKVIDDEFYAEVDKQITMRAKMKMLRG